jgi:hypothetical protein
MLQLWREANAIGHFTGQHDKVTMFLISFRYASEHTHWKWHKSKTACAWVVFFCIVAKFAFVVSRNENANGDSQKAALPFFRAEYSAAEAFPAVITCKLLIV